MICNRTGDREMISEAKSSSNGPWERSARNVRRVRIPIAALGAILVSLFSQTARADLITITGNLTSDGSAVGSGDPVIVNPSTINSGDPFSIVLSYDPASFTHSGSSYVLTNASLTLQFDSYMFSYDSAGGNYLEFSSPGVFGSGTTSFLICSSLANCSTEDFLTLYFQGTVTSPSTLAAQAGGLSGDPGASPTEFEFLRNFSDGSQTDLQGTLGTPASGPTPVPEPSALALLALVVGGLGGFRPRARPRS
ncbi:MAG TPA: PEP-CTERM sorting domain-containing protein [Bryobacteraceae bacterium]|nr:PEP-CTERM sorting domain-containing protein [Bryobacteraceae bacterium]